MAHHKVVSSSKAMIKVINATRQLKSLLKSLKEGPYGQFPFMELICLLIPHSSHSKCHLSVFIYMSVYLSIICLSTYLYISCM